LVIGGKGGELWNVGRKKQTKKKRTKKLEKVITGRVLAGIKKDTGPNSRGSVHGERGSTDIPFRFLKKTVQTLTIRGGGGGGGGPETAGHLWRGAKGAWRQKGGAKRSGRKVRDEGGNPKPM